MTTLTSREKQRMIWQFLHDLKAVITVSFDKEMAIMITLGPQKMALHKLPWHHLKSRRQLPAMADKHLFLSLFELLECESKVELFKSSLKNLVFFKAEVKITVLLAIEFRLWGLHK